MPTYEETINKILKEIEHPEIARTLFDLGMVRDIEIKRNKVKINLILPMKDVPIQDYLKKEIKEVIGEKWPNMEVIIDLKEMNEQERIRFVKMAKDAWRG